jgi:SAM-dependent methyltransferase
MTYLVYVIPIDYLCICVVALSLKTKIYMVEQSVEAGQEWFEVWFDTSEYHLLYQHRDIAEAASFISHLMQSLDLQNDIKVLDLACGRGRHTVQLAAYGFDVHGLDYAPSNIAYAKQQNMQDNIRYWLHDMRDPFPCRDLDLILNLFTSFGYFEQSEEHESVLRNVFDALRTGGVFVLDYFNTASVLNDMVHEEERIIDDYIFNISRQKVGRRIQKKITVTYPDEQKRHFEEWVEAFSREDLIKLIETAGFTLEGLYGDYQLNPFDAQRSPRLILKVRK